MSKIFILPSTVGGNEFHRIVLKHPKKSSEDCDYYCDDQNGRLFELNIKKNLFHSWFVDNSLVKDGNMFVMTPIDPLFLLVGVLMKSKNESFCSLFDIFSNDSPNTDPELINDLLLKKVFNNVKHLNCVADVKSFEDDIFVKFNKDKTLKWLKLKFEVIRKSLMKHQIKPINSSGYAISSFVQSSADQSIAQYDLMAMEILGDYINVQLEKELRTILRIEDDIIKTSACEPIKDKQDIPNGCHNNKRKIDSDKNINNNNELEQHLFESSFKKNDNSKKPKLSNIQRALSKVDKTGIKDISSYFIKKQKN